MTEPFAETTTDQHPSAQGPADATDRTPGADDPHGWLEDVEGVDQLAWVRERNAHAEAQLRGDRFDRMRAEIREVLDSTDKIPAVVQRGEYLYNFWTDAEHERGLWRRTTWDSYRSDSPEWEVLIDVDALGAEEGVNWVWHGARVLRPSHRRALVALSRGGSDADVTREFDLVTKQFVPDGFTREESKGGLAWADESGDAVFVYTDFGPGAMTTSGYPRTVRRWERGTPVEDAPEVFAGEPTDMVIGAARDQTPGFERDLVFRHRAFYDAELYLRDDDGELTLLDLPRSAEPDLHREWLTVELREDWTPAGTEGPTYPGGALLGIRLTDFLAGNRDFEVLYRPTSSTALAGTTWTRHHLVLNVLEDVTNRLEVLTPPERGGRWRRRPLDPTGDSGESTAVPELATIAVGAVDADTSDALWLTTTGFTTPTTLSRLDLDSDGTTTSVEALKSLPAFFDAEGMRVEQHFATSDDGTRVPYFQVTGAGVDTSDRKSVV